VLNTKSLIDDWKIVKFEFKSFHRAGKKKPDLTLIGGGLAFRKEIKNLIFPMACPELEFLPIVASGEEWLVTNCLKATKNYDHENSILYRRGADQIYMIGHIIVDDPDLEECEVFVVDDSNRTSLLALPIFVERITKLRLTGIQFKEIGLFTQSRGQRFSPT
jgi:hypothetical protein